MFALTEEQQDLQLSLRRFARREVRWKARKLDQGPPGGVDRELLGQCCDLGLISAQIPPDHGGAMDAISTAIALEEIAHWDGGFATLLSSNGLAQQALTLSGRQDLITQIFDAVIQCEAHQEPVLGALAVTERHVGSDFINLSVSDPARMMVTAKRRGDAYVLSGRKAYCAGGNIANWLCIFATVDDDRHLDGLTGFWMPTDVAGFHVSAVLPTMGLRGCPLVEFYVEGVEIPASHRLTEEGAGRALLHKLSASGRMQAAAIAVGIARGAFELARQHALNRVQGGGPIMEHQMVQHMLADMATQIEAARLLTYKAAATSPMDASLSSMAKVFASDAAVKVATDAVQIMGAFGTTMKSGAEKYYRDAKMTQIFQGANELCRLAITYPALQEAGLTP